ncbi:MAG: hemolysin family protein [Pseudomonadota bacterium]
MDQERAPGSAEAEVGRDGEPPEDEPGRQSGFFARVFGLGQDQEGQTSNAPGDHDATATERALLSNIKTMRDQRVDDIMIPRADIVAVPENASLEELTEAFRDGAHSRMPVYRDTLDDPVGFIHVKDVALARGFGAAADDRPFEIGDFLRQILVVPPSMLTRRLMQRMQKNRIHMALVVDEYGGVDGVVTIEDLVEQIVGDIEDEHDEAETVPWRRESDDVYVANARASLDAFEAEAGVDLLPDDLDEDVDTLGGLVFKLAHRVPERGEVVFHPQGHEFEVVDADPRRIKRLRVSLRRGAPLAEAAE